MKKLLALALAVVLALSVFAGCAAGGKKAELALITDIGTIDDKSFNQGAWEGLVKYAEEKGISHQYYQPTEKSTTAYLESIDQAVKNGAKVIVIDPRQCSTAAMADEWIPLNPQTDPALALGISKQNTRSV